MKRFLRFAAYGFAAIGLFALGYYAIVYLNARLFQAHETRQFARAFHTTPLTSYPSMKRPVPPPREGALLGRLEIPRLGLAVMVIEGVKDGDLSRAAGHIPGTALPGQSGNIGIAAHRDTFFRPLRGIRRNDTITLDTVHGAYYYRVVSTKIVLPEDMAVLNPTSRDTLTLVTCFPFHYIGAAPKRFVVRAVRIL